MSLAPLLLTCAIVAGSQQLEPSDSSVERLRAALARPPSKLTLRERQPDFKVEIRERQPFEQWLEQLPPLWAVEPRWWPRYSHAPGPFGSRPVYSVDLLAMASGIAKQLGEWRRARAQRDAMDEVARAILEYCAAQPNLGAGIAICDR